MAILRINLFGKFRIESNDQVVAGFEACKVQVLFSYLLLYRNRPHTRESLAAMLWGDWPTTQSKKYISQALWQIQSALKCEDDASQSRFLLAEPDWVHINPEAGMWLDVAESILSASDNIRCGLIFNIRQLERLM